MGGSRISERGMTTQLPHLSNRGGQTMLQKQQQGLQVSQVSMYRPFPFTSPPCSATCSLLRFHSSLQYPPLWLSPAGPRWLGGVVGGNGRGRLQSCSCLLQTGLYMELSLARDSSSSGPVSFLCICSWAIKEDRELSREERPSCYGHCPWLSPVEVGRSGSGALLIPPFLLLGQPETAVAVDGEGRGSAAEHREKGKGKFLFASGYCPHSMVY